jgi:hypothetical protein
MFDMICRIEIIVLKLVQVCYRAFPDFRLPNPLGLGDVELVFFMTGDRRSGSVAKLHRTFFSFC